MTRDGQDTKRPGEIDRPQGDRGMGINEQERRGASMNVSRVSVSWPWYPAPNAA